MPIDMAFLEAHRRIARPDAGVSEAFQDLTLSGSRSVATVYRPLRDAVRPTTAWVVCHSFGIEQTALMEHEVAAARAIAAAGMPVVRFLARGYGDAEGAPRGIGLGSHLADATSVVEHALQQGEFDRVGVIGGRLGGLVAALIAERCELPLMVLWEPVVDGSRAMRDLLRRRVITDMAQEMRRSNRLRSFGLSPAPAPVTADPAAELRARGWADIGGSVLTEDTYRDISSVDLRSAIRRFSGDALLLSVGRSPTPSPDVVGLAKHLRSIGAGCDQGVIVDPESANFGRCHHGSVDDLHAKRDLQAALEAKLASATAAWCLDRARTAALAGSSGSPRSGSSGSSGSRP